MRGSSSLLDVAVFLLLVSTAVTTLILVPGTEHRSPPVDNPANLLGTVTAEFEYTVADSRRRAHGTLATLLARGAVANSSIDGRPLSNPNGSFGERIRAETRSALGTTNRTEVIVRWIPYRGSPVHGTVRVGDEPPPRVDVSVATLTIPAPATSPREQAATGSDTGAFRKVGAAAARATADALLPESQETLPSNRVSPGPAVAASRFRTLANATDVSVERPLSRGNISLARTRVVDGLTDRFVADMRSRFDTPSQAVSALRVGTVRITLRRWGS